MMKIAASNEDNLGILLTVCKGLGKCCSVGVEQKLAIYIAWIFTKEAKKILNLDLEKMLF